MAEKLGQIEKALVQLRRIAEHRDAGAEQDIRKLYKECVTELQGFIGIEYAKYGKDDGTLDYSVLRNKSKQAKFLEELLAHIDTLTPQVRNVIQDIMEETYKLCYGGMVDAVISSGQVEKKVVKDLEPLKGISARTVTQAVKNPIDKLTLNEVLERHRKDVIYKIKKTVTLGITNGDSMPTMAQKVSEYLDKDYKKSVNVVRTEVHRVRETAFDDAAKKSDDALLRAKTGYRMVKIWRTMKDSAVRDTKDANHVKMDGVTILQDEKFVLSSGAKTDCPGKSGVAAEDCNCRCFLSRDMMNDEEFYKATGRHFDDKTFDISDKNVIIKSGAKSGALDPESDKAFDHADRYYKSVRRMTTDVKRISQNTGFSKKDINAVKNFIFIEKHDLGGSEKEYFAPSYEMAQTWQRLIDGKNIQQHDLTLIKHELMERELISKGMTQDEAHRLTSEKYNYKEECEKYYGSLKKSKKDR